MSALEPVTRPNGKIYRPRKIRVETLFDKDSIEAQILVLGTHDTTRAQEFADQVVRSIDGNSTAETPRTGWWRKAIRDHQPFFEDDEIRGAAGVMFGICDI